MKKKKIVLATRRPSPSLPMTAQSAVFSSGCARPNAYRIERARERENEKREKFGGQIRRCTGEYTDVVVTNVLCTLSGAEFHDISPNMYSVFINYSFLQ